MMPAAKTLLERFLEEPGNARAFLAELDKARREAAAAAGGPAWTTVRPVAEGHYWLRVWPPLGGTAGRPYVVTVDDDRGRLWAWSYGRAAPVDEVDPRSLWAGPLTPPG